MEKIFWATQTKHLFFGCISRQIEELPQIFPITLEVHNEDIHIKNLSCKNNSHCHGCHGVTICERDWRPHTGGSWVQDDIFPTWNNKKQMNLNQKTLAPPLQIGTDNLKFDCSDSQICFPAHCSVMLISPSNT